MTIGERARAMMSLHRREQAAINPDGSEDAAAVIADRLEWKPQ
jgi:hypothetical protein